MSGMGGGAWMQLRSYTRDRSVSEQRLRPGTISRVAGYARPYKALVIGLLINLSLDAVLVVVQPLLIRHIIDDGVGTGARSVVIAGSLLLGLVGILDMALGISGRYFSSRIGEGLIYDLRTEVFQHVQEQSLAFFTRTQTGALVSRLNSDVLGAQQAFTSTLTNVVGNLVSLAAILIAMTALSWQITALSLALVPLFLIPARFIGGRIAGLTREQFNLNAEMSASMTERFNVAGAALVKLYGHAPTEASAFSAKAARVRDIGIRIALSNRLFFSMLSVVAAIATAFAYGFGGVTTISGALSIGTLLAIVSLLGRMYAPLTGLANVRVDVMTALVSFERVFEVLDLPSLVRDPQSPVSVPSGSLDIEFDHVTFRYPQASEVSLASLEAIAKADTMAEHSEVLHDVTFRIPAGQLVALVGPSGAGKTTASALVPRLYDVSEGSVRIGGIDVRQFVQSELRNCIGVVSQDAHLFHDTIRANLRYARPDASDGEIVEALQLAQLSDLLANLTNGLDTVVGDRGHRLSGGEKQRMAIARVFLKQPRIIVLDEATAHLDSESEAAVQKALTLALQGRTALVIAHRLSTVRNAEAIVVLQDGAVVDIGTHAQLLLRGGLYADLYATQFAE